MAAENGSRLANDASAAARLTGSVKELYAYFSFSRVEGLLDLGTARQLDVDSARALHSKELDPNALVSQFTAAYLPKDSDSGQPNALDVWRACAKILYRSVTAQFLWLSLQTCIRLSTPFVLREFLKWLESYKDGDVPYWKGWLWGSLLAMNSFLIMIVLHRLVWCSLFSGFKLRMTLTAVVHAKLLKLNSSSIAKVTTGRIVNIVSNDLKRCDLLLTMGMFLLFGPLEAIVVLFAVGSVLGFLPAAAGMSCLLFLIPTQSFLSKYIRRWRQKTTDVGDKRISLTGELISGNLAVKMLGWEDPLIQDVKTIREQEDKLLTLKGCIRAVNMALPNATRAVVVCSTFITYRLTVGEFNVPDVFFALSLMMLLRLTLTMFFVAGVELVSEAWVTFRKIDAFLKIPESRPIATKETPCQKGEIRIDQGNYGWYGQENGTKSDCRSRSRFGALRKESKSTLETDAIPVIRPVLKDVNFAVRSGELIGIAGEVAAGKSSLLAALLNDMENLSNAHSAQLSGSVSFCAQSPWIMAGSVKENILFGRSYDEEHYVEVVRSCALEPDFEQFPLGDATLLGERGINISGGQKARVALARAAYSGADIQLLDDPLSAVDPRVGRILFDKCIGNGGVMTGSTRLLVTHQRQFLPLCDRIIVMKDGRIEAVGRWEELKDHPVLRTVQKDDGSAVCQDAADKAPELLESSASSNSDFAIQTDQPRPNRPAALVPETAKRKQMMDTESKASGIVAASVYWRYICHIGLAPMVAAVFTLAAAQGLYFFSEYWVGAWASADAEDQDDTSWIWVLISTYSTGIVASVLSLVSLFSLMVKGSTRLHAQMLERVVHAPLRFFHTNPTGRILNRFSKDVGHQDEELPHVANDTLSNLLVVFGTVALVCAALPYMAVFFLIVAWIFWRVRRRYVVTSREVKRYDGITRSPVYAMLSENIKGLATIKAFGSEAAFQQRFADAMDLNGSWWTAFLLASRWVGVRMDGISTLTMLFSVILAILFAKTVPAEVLGLALTYTISLSGLLQWAMRQTAELENMMTSAERNLEYTILEQEPPRASEGGGEAPEGWPCSGRVEYKSVTASYRPGLDPVLKNLSFVIPGGSTVGIVGRTGSGKSSLLLTLFRLIDIDNGQIKIDGVDTGEIGIDVLRKQLAVIPQDPVLFGGTLRSNVDPWKQHSDAKVLHVLSQVCLESVTKHVGGLDALVAECGGNLSVGQRQLLCLARALLADTKILALDEATANVDRGTDALIQASLRSLIKQKDKTLFIIAHRIDTVMDCDVLLVLDEGKLVEFGSPQSLLDRPPGTFAQMAEAATKSRRHSSNLFPKGIVSNGDC